MTLLTMMMEKTIYYACDSDSAKNGKHDMLYEWVFISEILTPLCDMTNGGGNVWVGYLKAIYHSFFNLTTNLWSA